MWACFHVRVKTSAAEFWMSWRRYNKQGGNVVLYVFIMVSEMIATIIRKKVSFIVYAKLSYSLLFFSDNNLFLTWVVMWNYLPVPAWKNGIVVHCGLHLECQQGHSETYAHLQHTKKQGHYMCLFVKYKPDHDITCWFLDDGFEASSSCLLR